MRTLFGFGLVALILGFTTGCGGEPKLDGTYIIVGLERDGQAAPQKEIDEESEEKRTIRIEGNKLIAVKGGKEDAVTFTTDPKKSPRTIDITETRPSGKTETMYGIYKLEGDTLTICMNEKADNRPKEFKTSKDSDSTMITLKKKK